MRLRSVNLFSASVVALAALFFALLLSAQYELPYLAPSTNNSADEVVIYDGIPTYPVEVSTVSIVGTDDSGDGVGGSGAGVVDSSGGAVVINDGIPSVVDSSDGGAVVIDDGIPGVDIVDVSPVRVRIEDVYPQVSSWGGKVECLFGDEKVEGDWSYDVYGSSVSGKVSIPGFGTGVLSGVVEGDALDASVVYSVLGYEQAFSWAGTVSEKNVEGDANFVGAGGQVGGCVWAGSAVLDVTYGNITTVTKNNSISVTYEPICRENCTKIVFVQTVCRKAVLSDGSEGSFKPGELDPNWAEKNDVTVNGGRLCTVDYTIGEADPYYNGDDPQDGGAKGKHAGSLNATMHDAPRYTDVAFENLKRKFGKDVSKVILEFEVCAFCAEGRDAGKVYGCFKWDYEQEKGKEGTATDKGGSGTLSSQKFKEALKKWAEVKRFPLPPIR